MRNQKTPNTNLSKESFSHSFIHFELALERHEHLHRLRHSLGAQPRVDLIGQQDRRHPRVHPLQLRGGRSRDDSIGVRHFAGRGVEICIVQASEEDEFLVGQPNEVGLLAGLRSLPLIVAF